MFWPSGEERFLPVTTPSHSSSREIPRLSHITVSFLHASLCSMASSEAYSIDQSVDPVRHVRLIRADSAAWLRALPAVVARPGGRGCLPRRPFHHLPGPFTSTRE